MAEFDLNTTICGIATPSGEGGIGIIRISGSDTVDICTRIFCKHKNSVGEDFLKNYWQDRTKSRNLIHGYIFDPFNAYIIDEVLIALMRRPFSYTKEDVIEIHSHGGPVILRNILDLLITLGARIAEPGEFTKRAFLNGRIDLTQAEAVLDLVQAKNTHALKMANASLSGELSHCIVEIREQLIEIIAEIQAVIEFPDEVSELTDRDGWIRAITKLLKYQLEPLVSNYQAAKFTRNGFKVGIIGRPNVGKSSLLNALLKKERAIVTDIPGTTRDVIEDRVMIEGVEVFLCDTAGIRNSEDTIEQIGVKKSLDIKNSCDLILFMVDAREPFNSDDIFIHQELKGSPIIYIINKIDLIDEAGRNKLVGEISYKSVVYISATNDLGLDTLKTKIFDFAQENFSHSIDASIVPNLRQSKLLAQSCDVLRTAIADFEQNLPEDIVVIGLEEVSGLLGKVLGIDIEPDILDHIFNNFCIGK